MAKANSQKKSNGNDSGLIRGIDANLGLRNADSFRANLHPDLKSDFVPVWKDLANPPLNDSDWFRKDDVVRWPFSRRTIVSDW